MLGTKTVAASGLRLFYSTLANSSPCKPVMHTFRGEAPLSLARSLSLSVSVLGSFMIMRAGGAS